MLSFFLIFLKINFKKIVKCIPKLFHTILFQTLLTITAQIFDFKPLYLFKLRLNVFSES